MSMYQNESKIRVSTVTDKNNTVNIIKNKTISTSIVKYFKVLQQVLQQVLQNIKVV